MSRYRSEHGTRKYSRARSFRLARDPPPLHTRLALNTPKLRVCPHPAGRAKFRQRRLRMHAAPNVFYPTPPALTSNRLSRLRGTACSHLRPDWTARPPRCETRLSHRDPTRPRLAPDSEYAPLPTRASFPLSKSQRLLPRLPGTQGTRHGCDVFHGLAIRGQYRILTTNLPLTPLEAT